MDPDRPDRACAGQRAVRTVRPDRECRGRTLPDRRRLRLAGPGRVCRGAAQMILPDTGRGTAPRSGGVEGHARLFRTSAVRSNRLCPSTILCDGPPPPVGADRMLSLALAGCTSAPPPPAAIAPDHRQPQPLRRRDPRRSRRSGAIAGAFALQPRSARQLDAAGRGAALPRRPAGRSRKCSRWPPTWWCGDDFMAPATRAAFRRLGVRVETIGIDSTVADSEAQIRHLAALAGHTERGEALVARIDAAMAETRRTAPWSRRCCGSRAASSPAAQTLAAHLLGNRLRQSVGGARAGAGGLPAARARACRPAASDARRRRRAGAEPTRRCARSRA